MMRDVIHAALLAMVLAFLGPALPAHAAAIDDALAQAEAVRTSDPRKFARALEGLDALQANATPNQKLHIRLLKTYQKALTGDYGAAIADAIDIHKHADDPTLKFRAALLAANTAAVTREFSLGLRYLEIALAMQDQVPEADDRHIGSLVGAILYTEYGQHALSLDHANQLLATETTPRTRCVARQKKIEAEWKLGARPDNEREIQLAISDCMAQKEPIATGLLRGYLARQWAAADQTDKAITLLESHLPEVEATGFPRLIGEIHGLLAEYRQTTGDIAGAEKAARHVVDLGVNDAYSLPLVTAYKVLFEMALKRGDLSAALDEYRNYAEADKARLDEIKAREFAFQISRHELKQKNQDIELLQKQNEVLRLQQEVSKAAAENTRLLVVLLVTVLVVIVLWAYKVKRVQVAFRRASEIDGLTGIANRRHFRHSAEVLLERCAGAGREAALVVLDLDHFKRINDQFGHAIGDWVLQQVAKACQAACRDGDVCGRLGGEEFAIVCCGCDMDTARRIAERCREHLAAIDTTVIGLPVTASIGITTSSRSGYRFETLFTHADAAMYHAKARGRDHVRVYGDDGAGPAAVLELVRG